MNEFLKKTLYYSLIPLGLALLICITGDMAILFAGMMLLFVVGGYFLAGLIMILTGREQTGKALLLSCGIILLVGLSTCGIILSNLKLGGMH
ncbi:hypothetical protein SAMN05444266_104270 [Chitinophaga jiangningensis]|uniref:Uncharacterized protein n=1 Tax=Chitinophaga jiangningensis TaxID=1419482 RepID=A0A1M7CBZ7_9BACT|nr:hypothetical protein [Chitinophaga jiangningensis]SHL64710.1 hypothetical protein SAMN05444266_104270 [Chitinophaga jiangningensis]